MTKQTARPRRLVCAALLTTLLLGVSAQANEVYSQKGVVVTRSELASQAGVEAMRRGGNAIDAIVSAAFTLAVTYPSAGNLGGGGFAVIHLADGTVVTNDHREVAPAQSTRDMFLDSEGQYRPEISLRSHLSSGVPGSVAGLLDIHERFGVLSREDILDQAIHLARDGFVLSYPRARSIGSREERWKQIPSSAAVFLREDGTPHEPGDRFRQPDLADTLSRIQELGKEGFYTGQTADLIVAEMQRHGGLISHEDLANYRSVWREPVTGTYREYEIVTMGPPSSGGVLLVNMLNTLESFDVASMGFGSAATVHLMIEAERRAFADRATHLGDPDFYDVPIAMLTSKKYALERFTDFNAERATGSGDVGPGDVAVVDEGTETTHLSAMDGDGNAVSLTTTLNSGYGSGIVVDGAGFLLNNEMDDFSAKPNTPNAYGLVGGEANAIAPRKRMLSSMTPTIVLRDGRPVLVLGSPGGPTIITTVFQITINRVDHGMTLFDAVASPRFHHQWLPDSIRAERHAFSADTELQLRSMGHENLRVGGSTSKIGDAHAIIHRDDGWIVGVSDPRHDGHASGL